MGIEAGVSSVSLVRADILVDSQAVEYEVKQTHHSATGAGGGAD